LAEKERRLCRPRKLGGPEVCVLNPREVTLKAVKALRAKAYESAASKHIQQEGSQ
jgi:hypothetical protein